MNGQTSRIMESKRDVDDNEMRQYRIECEELEQVTCVKINIKEERLFI